MIEDTDDLPPRPPPEFDPDADYALASPGLFAEERVDIIQRARGLREGGLAGEALCNWICREVARTVGGRSGFEGRDSGGKVIDPPHVATARKQIKREAGKKRHIRRNADIEQWQQRCQQLRDAGLPATIVRDKCWSAVIAAYRNAHRKAGEKEIYMHPEFKGLPILYGRDGKSLPKKRRLMQHF